VADLLPAPDRTTPHGVHAWLVPGPAFLVWSGEHDLVRLCPAVGGAGAWLPGAPVEVVSGRCGTLTEAQHAVTAWVRKTIHRDGTNLAAPGR
jgi:hypothetical protein